MADSCVSKISIDLNDKICTTNPGGKGVEPIGKIINWDDVDWDSVEWDSTNKNIIKALPLLVGKKAQSIYQHGDEPFKGGTCTNRKLTCGTVWDKGVQFYLQNDSPEVAQVATAMASGGKFIILLNKIEKGLQKATGAGNQAFKFIGLHQGVKFNADGDFVQDDYSDDSNGGYVVKGMERGAPVANVFLFDTDYATSKTKYDSYDVAVPTPP